MKIKSKTAKSQSKTRKEIQELVRLIDRFAEAYSSCTDEDIKRMNVLIDRHGMPKRRIRDYPVSVWW